MSTNRDRIALAAIVFTVLFAQVLVYPGVDTLVTALGAATTLDASMWFLAAEFAAFIAFAGAWGAVSDSTGCRVRYIVAGALGGAVGYFSLALLPLWLPISFGTVLAVRFLQGAATIGAFSLAMTMLMDLEGGHGRNMGAAGIAIGLGTALGAPVGGQLYELSPFVPLVVAGTSLVVASLLTATVADRVPSRAPRSLLDIVTGVRRRPALAVPYAFGGIDRLTAGFFALVGTLYFREGFGLDPGTTGLLLAGFFAPFALLQYPMGVVSDRVGRTAPIVLGSALYGVGVIAVGHAPTVGLVAIAMVTVGVLGAVMAPATMALVTDLAAETERGVAMAGFNAIGSVGFLVGIVVGGTVAGTYGYTAAFLAAGSLEVGLAVVTLPAFLNLDLDRVSGRSG